MLVARNAPGDAAPAQTLLALARTAAQDLQMQGLMPHLQDLQSRVPPTLTPGTSPDVVSEKASAPRRTAGTTPEPGLASQPAENLFRKEGDYWTLAYQGKTCHLKDTRGLRAIASLPAGEQRPRHLNAGAGPERRQGGRLAASHRCPQGPGGPLDRREDGL